MKFAVVNTLRYGEQSDYENDPNLLKALKEINCDWIQGKEWKKDHKLDFKDEDLLAVIELKNIHQL